MNTFIYAAALLVAYLCNLLIMYGLAWLLTEVIRLPWHVKPFTCRACMSFWLTILGGVVIAFVVTPYVPGCDLLDLRVFLTGMLIGVSVLLGIINFLYIKSKFKVYE